MRAVTGRGPKEKNSRPAANGKQTTERTTQDRDKVVRAAIALIDEHGVNALSMRRLGAKLGVQAMSLYTHVNGREHLIDEIIEAIVNDLFDDPETHLREADSWQDYLVRVAHGARRSALAHPRVFPLIATRPPEAPWIRPPLRSLRWVDSFLASLKIHGFSDDAAVYTYRAFTSFLLGHLLLEVSALGAQIGPLPSSVQAAAEPDGALYDGTLHDGALGEGAAQDGDKAASTKARHSPSMNLDDYPHLQQLRSKLAENASFDEFEESLENLLTRLEDVRHYGIR